MRISDWSSDVCSSDLAADQRDAERFAAAALLVHLVAVDRGGGGSVGARRADEDRWDGAAVLGADIGRGQQHDGCHRLQRAGDWKSVEEGKSVQVRVDLGGSRISTKTKH